MVRLSDPNTLVIRRPRGFDPSDERSSKLATLKACGALLRRIWEVLTTYPDSMVTVRIDYWSAQRSLPQNKRYWKLYVPAMRSIIHHEYGADMGPDYAHQVLKYHFLPWREAPDPATGEVTSYRDTSTTSLSKAEFSAYLDAIRQWMLDEYTYDPDPPNPYL